MEFIDFRLQAVIMDNHNMNLCNMTKILKVPIFEDDQHHLLAVPMQSDIHGWQPTKKLLDLKAQGYLEFYFSANTIYLCKYLIYCRPICSDDFDDINRGPYVVGSYPPSSYLSQSTEHLAG